jgi:hypothetical protein
VANFGISWRVDRSPHWEESTVCTWQLLTIATFIIHTYYSIRFWRVRPHVPNYRSNRQRRSSHRVWEC